MNHTLENPLILVADDDAPSRDLLSRMLRTEGYRVECAIDGPDTLEKYHLVQPDAILLDVKMPGLDGFEVCERLRTESGQMHVPVIVVTALGDQESIDQAFRAGAVDYINKPIYWPLVRHRISQLVLGQQVKHELEAERNQLRTLIDNLPDYIFIKDTQGRFLLSNSAHSQAVQTRTDEMLGETADQFWAKDLADQYQADDRQVIESGQALINAERTSVDASGKRITVLTTKVPLRNRQGEIAGLVGISRDITEHKRTLEALDVSSTQLNNLLESLDEVVFSLDTLRLKTIQVSPACEKVFGVSQQAFSANSQLWRQLVHPEDAPRIPLADSQLRAGETVQTEFRIVRPDGETRWINMKMRPVLDGNGILVRTDGLATDITQHKQAEEALVRSEVAEREQAVLRQALEQEKELSNLKTNFVSMVSHEFRTPLTVISTSVGLLQMALSRMTEAQQQRHFSKVMLAIHDMTQLLDDVITLAQADASGLPFNPEPLDLSELCEELIEDVSLTSGKTHRLSFTSSGVCENVVADRRLLRHIVLNLCTNAVKYSPEGSSVHITLACNGNLATLAISDQGIGIPEAEHQHLFDTFHRGKNVGAVPGTGLGLAITKRAVDRHGGNISFETKVGQGTTFTVSFPISGQTGMQNIGRD